MELGKYARLKIPLTMHKKTSNSFRRTQGAFVAIAEITKSDFSNEDKIKLQQLIYEQDIVASPPDGMQMRHQIHG